MRGRFGAAVLLAALSSGCSPAVDLTRALEVIIVSTGWFDEGVVRGGVNKLVPSVSFQLKNVSDQPLTVLQANVLFHRVTDPEEWGSGFLRVRGSDGLAPGDTTEVLTVKSQNGYTGSEPRVDMLKNKEFVDAKVRILGKTGSGQWTRLGEYPVERRIIVR
jgi:hypothetical protein